MRACKKTIALGVLVLAAVLPSQVAHALPTGFLPKKWCDVDKTHTGQYPSGAFLGIAAN
jgi:hypothetical protein